MSHAMYVWRKLTDSQRQELLRWRQQSRNPWHSPPHREGDSGRYLITAACFEHQPLIGFSAERMATFATTLLKVFEAGHSPVHAWVVLPNHYHVLADTRNVLGLLKEIGLMHGRSSHQWNGEEDRRGRQVWCKAAETSIRSERHFWAALNYVHHNPVRHGYARLWLDWPFSSAADYLASVGRERAQQIWKEYPVLDFGKDWDAPEM